MPRSKQYFSLILFMLSVVACALPGISSDTDAISTSAAETIIAGLTQNVTEAFTPTIGPTLTSTFTPTLIYLSPRVPSETPTNTPLPGTETATPEATFTLTPFDIEIKVSRPTHCRSGPGKSFEIVGSLLVGMKAKVIGRDATSQYWYIENPYVFTDYCWVWGEYATFTGGNQLLLPVVTSPATPTTTGTAVPTLEFKMEGKGKQTCNGYHWVNIAITNTSEQNFSSIKIEMQDVNNNVFRSVTYNYFPYSVECDKLVVEDSILSDGTEIVSGPKFDYNLSGTKLLTSITICTEKDQKGICTTREIKINP